MVTVATRYVAFERGRSVPDAIAIGPLVVPVLRLGALLALVLGAWVAHRIARRWEQDAGQVGRTAEWSLYAFVAGARLGFAAENWSAYADAPWTVVYLWQPGYALWAGVVAAAVLVGGRLAFVGSTLRRYHAGALGIGALIAVVAYASVAGIVRLDFAPGTVRVGDPAPTFSLRDLDGSEVGLADVRGRVVVLNFWATWCPPCRREMPALNAVHHAYASEEVAVVGVDVGERADVVERFLDQTPVDYAIWVEPSRGEVGDNTSELSRRFGGVGLPTTVFIDRDGIVRKIRVGELSRAVIENEVQHLLR